MRRDPPRDLISKVSRLKISTRFCDLVWLRMGCNLQRGFMPGHSRLKFLTRICHLSLDTDAANTQRDYMLSISRLNFWYAFWVQIRMRCEPRRNFCDPWRDSLRRLSILKLSLRLYNFGLDPDAVRPTARLCDPWRNSLSRLLRPSCSSTQYYRNTRLSRLKCSEQHCISSLNPNAALLKPKFMFNFSRLTFLMR